MPTTQFFKRKKESCEFLSCGQVYMIYMADICQPSAVTAEFIFFSIFQEQRNCGLTKHTKVAVYVLI